MLEKKTENSSDRISKKKENNNNVSKIIIGLLVLLLAGASAMYFSKNTELKEAKTTLTTEITNLKEDLKNQKVLLNQKIEENDVLNEDLIKQRDDLDEMLNKLNNAEISIGTLSKYKNKYLKLKMDIEDLMIKNDMLQMANKLLVSEKDSISGKLNAQKKLNNSLATQVVINNKKIQIASEVVVLALKGISIKERKSGKQILTNKARRANKLKICFSLAPNALADKGSQELYIQVIAPGNNILGENSTLKFGNNILDYTLKSKFNYDKKALNICEYISEPKKGFAKGTYFINVFRNDKIVANNSFDLE